MKIIGWVLIITGIISIINNGIYLSFEGIITTFIPIIGGIILLVKTPNKNEC